MCLNLKFSSANWASVFAVETSATHLVAVDRLSTGSVTVGKVTTLRPGISSQTNEAALVTHMKFLMIRWKEDPSYPNPSSSPSSFFPVQSARKFSTVFGTVLVVSSQRSERFRELTFRTDP